MSLILPREDEIQTAIITRTKEIDFEGLMTSAEVREYEWMGTEFTYPNVRVDLSLIYNPNRCNHHDVDITLYVYSEKSTSKQANRLAGIIANAYTPVSFLRNGIQFYGMHVTSVSRAIALGASSSESEWQAKVHIKGMVVKN